MIKKLISAVSAGVVTLGFVGVMQAPTVNADEPDPKVFVCKYVGTPGVDERLQTGDNPISVSANATSGAQVGESFNDKQGRSLVLKIDDTEPGPEGDPDVSECPAPQGEVLTPNTAVNSVCVQSEQLVRLTFVNSGKAESTVSVNGTESKVAAGATVNATTPITGPKVSVTVVVDGKSQVVTVECPTGGSGGGTTVTTAGGSGQVAVATPRPAAATANVVSLPVTSAGNGQVVGLMTIIGSILAAAGTYIVRNRHSAVL